MPQIEVGQQPASGGIGGIPTKYVVIGAGVLGVAAILLMQSRKGSAPAQTGDMQPTGSTSAQLSSLQQMQLQQFGEITKLFQSQGEQLDTAVGGLSTHLDTNAAALSSALGLTNDQLKALADQMASGQTYSQTAFKQIWDQIAKNQNLTMQGLYQTFMRATNPSWMPGGQDDPFSPSYTPYAMTNGVMSNS